MSTSPKRLAIENYKYFCSLEGNKHIATEYALECILTLIERFKVKNILELGMGIGAVTDSVLKYSELNEFELNYTGTENNDFCLSVLPKYVESFSKVTSYPELKDVPSQEFDLIIVDGSDGSIDDIRKYCSQNAILFIEGDRAPQTSKMMSLFPKHKFVHLITLKKFPKYCQEGTSVKSYIGGGKLIFVNPTMGMKLFWFQRKISTFLKYKLRVVLRLFK